jgi:hypothetical protein
VTPTGNPHRTGTCPVLYLGANANNALSKTALTSVEKPSSGNHRRGWATKKTNGTHQTTASSDQVFHKIWRGRYLTVSSKKERGSVRNQPRIKLPSTRDFLDKRQQHARANAKQSMVSSTASAEQVLQRPSQSVRPHPHPSFTLVSLSLRPKRHCEVMLTSCTNETSAWKYALAKAPDSSVSPVMGWVSGIS